VKSEIPVAKDVCVSAAAALLKYMQEQRRETCANFSRNHWSVSMEPFGDTFKYLNAIGAFSKDCRVFP
jgi:hypothetical protein